ncbi:MULTISPECIES: DUF3299 domain-containing protein [Deefgea]|uniref:DUF3299 domain-containing protein n=1 Tax=Deefgea chitinilytica TaxID=570276 RepID=A0ABS2CE45_9NEIS|nr:MULTISPECIES: DUF3299 domain-containing protein [Deefgea]MBM5572419.1 DUF3299 domain-containing protein [Deefgea chitinilytica]MBM9889655.1 DUF3299 domain-containing protein [Deefgea sp. CFH1-16]
MARVLLILIAALFSNLVLAAEAKVVKWPQLQPDDPALRKAITSMNQEQKSRLMRAIQQLELKQQLESNKVKPANLTAADVALLKEDLKDLKPLISEIEAFEKKRISEMIPSLQGQVIELSGYLLPLKLKGKLVTEFLLVPVIGACIHVPAPPPNQMVVVQYPAGFAQGDLFAPVTVVGKLAIKSAKANLALADGAADVDVGYQMLASEVRAYNTTK